jgi:hypothetical protein
VPDELVMRRAERTDLRAIVAMLADDGIGARRESFDAGTADVAPEYIAAFDAIDGDPDELLVVACMGDDVDAQRFYESLGFHATHEGMKIALADA